MVEPASPPTGAGLSLAAFRATRPSADGEELGRQLCPPYDVIGPQDKQRLLAGSPDNFVAIVLPEPTEDGYAGAARLLEQRVQDGTLAVDDAPALYVYELTTAEGATTRGLLGAVELRAPEDGVILPHENTMAGPVADRLAVMTRTDADLEPIYLVYDGGGAASAVLGAVDGQEPVAQTTTPDGTRHRLWAVTDPAQLDAIERDLATRRALIADGHHRYATYRERQRLLRAERGPGPWDRGLALLVDSTQYGPQVHPIHRVVPGLPLDAAVRAVRGTAEVTELPGAAAQELLQTLGEHDQEPALTAVLSDGQRAVLLRDHDGTLAAAARRAGEPDALTELDVTVLHRAVVEGAWQLPDDVDHVGYAHSAQDALDEATATDGVAVLLRATPAAAVAAVAAAGARMPRKSTLFTPKPASGLVIRRLGDHLSP